MMDSPDAQFWIHNQVYQRHNKANVTKMPLREVGLEASRRLAIGTAPMRRELGCRMRM
jgi:hypothetical protein